MSILNVDKTIGKINNPKSLAILGSKPIFEKYELDHNRLTQYIRYFSDPRPFQQFCNEEQGMDMFLTPLHVGDWAAWIRSDVDGGATWTVWPVKIIKFYTGKSQHTRMWKVEAVDASGGIQHIETFRLICIDFEGIVKHYGELIDNLPNIQQIDDMEMI